jgi:transcriptional regulator of acetoin/glycerol metabolism
VAARTEATVLGVESIRDALAIEPGGRRPVPYRLCLPSSLTADDIEAALRATKGSVAGAAKHLGVPRSTLRDRIRSYTATNSSAPQGA